MENNEESNLHQGESSIQENDQEQSLEDMTPFVDCYLVCDSGRRFPAIRAVLALKSKVLQGLFVSCSQDAQSSPDPVKVPMVGESEDDVELLWKLWHGKLQLFDEVLNVKQPALLPETLDRITSIARLADKYQSTELLDQLEGFLLLDEFFNAIAYVDNHLAGSPSSRRVRLSCLYRLWTLSCEYGLRRLLSSVECALSQGEGLDESMYFFGDANPEKALNMFSARGSHFAAISLLTIFRKRENVFLSGGGAKRYKAGSGGRHQLYFNN